MWYVDREVVTLGGGLGTGNSILVRVERGDELSEIGRDGKWINVIVASAGVNGWVLGQLVSTQQ